jgi:sialate O-acetylesterase
LAGADGVYFAAHARLEEATVLVWHESVNQPATLRYAWADNPPVTLFDQEGWPTAPFCIDLRNSKQQQTCV